MEDSREIELSLTCRKTQLCSEKTIFLVWSFWLSPTKILFIISHQELIPDTSENVSWVPEDLGLSYTVRM